MPQAQFSAPPAPLKVTFVLNELTYSGAERMLAAIGALWPEQGVEASILAVGRDEGPYADALRRQGYAVRHLRFSRDIGFLFRLWRFFAVAGCDVVHIHCERANVWLALAARLTGGRRRLLRSVHNVFAFEGALRWRRLAQRWLARQVFGVTFVAVSPSVLENERRRFNNPCQLMENWIDIQSFSPPSLAERQTARALLGLADQDFALVTVGNCSEVKNHGAILTALPHLPGTVFLHCGQSAETAGEVDLARELGVADRVRFLGWRDNVFALLAAADCFVMPSLYEGLGMAAVEALACGMPVVLADVPGLRDLRRSGAEITWCSPDADSIIAAVNKVAAQTGRQRESAGLSNASLMRRHYHPVRALKESLDLYRPPPAVSAPL